MRFRRPKSNVTDLEAFRRGAASVGGLDLPQVDESVLRSGGQLKQYGPRPRISTAHPNHSPTSSAVGEHRAPLSSVRSGVDGGALSNVGCGDSKDVGQRAKSSSGADLSGCPTSPTSIAEVCERLDILREDNSALQRDNARLRSELNQTLAQLRIARRQRDEARAQLDHATKE